MQKHLAYIIRQYNQFQRLTTAQELKVSNTQYRYTQFEKVVHHLKIPNL